MISLPLLVFAFVVLHIPNVVGLYGLQVAHPNVFPEPPIGV